LFAAGADGSAGTEVSARSRLLLCFERSIEGRDGTSHDSLTTQNLESKSGSISAQHAEHADRGVLMAETRINSIGLEFEITNQPLPAELGWPVLTLRLATEAADTVQSTDLPPVLVLILSNDRPAR